MPHIDTATPRSPIGAVWETIKLARLQVFASGVVSWAILGTSAMQEAFRYTLLDAWDQLVPITLCMSFACWTLSWTINAKRAALAPDLNEPHMAAGLFSQFTADLISVFPAMAAAMSLTQIALMDLNDAGRGYGLLDDALAWAAALLLAGVAATLLGRTRADDTTSSPKLILTLRLFALVWIFAFSFILIWGAALMAAAITKYSVAQLVPNYDQQSSITGLILLWGGLVVACTIVILLMEIAFSLLPQKPDTKFKNPILRFIDDRLTDMPLFIPIIMPGLVLAVFYAGAVVPMDLRSFFLFLPGVIPFGYLLRLGHGEPQTPSRTMFQITRFTNWFPLLLITMPLAIWLLSHILLFEEIGMFSSMEIVSAILPLLILGFLPLGLVGLNPFVRRNGPLSGENADDGDWASMPFRLPGALRAGLDHLALMPANDQRGLMAVLIGAASLSVFFTFDLLGAGAGFVQVQDYVGPVGMTLIWCAAATGLFFLLSFIADAVRVPLVTIAVLWGVGLSVLAWNDNHRVANTTPIAPCDDLNDLNPIDCQPHEKDQSPNQGAEFNLVDWIESRRDLKDYQDPLVGKDNPYPVFIVATEGGGLRAAYFTSTVLASIQDLCPKFSEHILGISSVSGGSMGAAVFSMSASVLHGWDTILPCKALSEFNPKSTTGLENQYRRIARKTFTSDLLTPTLVGSLFPDALQRILPIEIPSWDRALNLERAFESAFLRASSGYCARCNKLEFTRDLTTNFLDVTDPFPTDATDAKDLLDKWVVLERKLAGWHKPPALYFNLTEVESGKPRVLGSKSLVFSQTAGGELSTLNKTLPDIKTLKLSTAAVLSARFPYLTPAGKISLTTGWDRRFGDGGYFENSGTWSARALAQKTLKDAKLHNKKIAIHLIVLRSSPLDETAECLNEVAKLVEVDAVTHRKNKKANDFRRPLPFEEKDAEKAEAEEAKKYKDKLYWVSNVGESEKVDRCVRRLGNYASSNEVMSPIRAVLNSRIARGDLSQLELESFADTMNDIQPGLVTVHALAFTNIDNEDLYEEDIPLTWILSKRSRKFLDASVEAIMTGASSANESKKAKNARKAREAKETTNESNAREAREAKETKQEKCVREQKAEKEAEETKKDKDERKAREAKEKPEEKLAREDIEARVCVPAAKPIFDALLKIKSEDSQATR